MIPPCLAVIIAVAILVWGFMLWVPIATNIKQLSACVVWVGLILYVVLVCVLHATRLAPP